MSVYYNEHDKRAAATLRELIAEGYIAPGDVDERSIEDVSPAELVGYTQRHFFAGGGIWSLALRNAGWPDDRPVATASFPCQPFSAAGKGAGFADDRHLWPAGYWHVVFGDACPWFGEQVSSADGLAWFDVVSADLERAGYAVGANDTCAAGFGAPHIRQRLYWMAVPEGVRHEWAGSAWRRRTGSAYMRVIGGLAYSDGEQEYASTARGLHDHIGGGSAVDGLGNAVLPGLQGFGKHDAPPKGWQVEIGSNGNASIALRLDDTSGLGRRAGGHGDYGGYERVQPYADGALRRPSPTNGFWRDADWLLCRPEPGYANGRWRPIKSGTFPLAYGYPERVGLLRLAGNALCEPVARGWIEAGIEELKERGLW